METFTGGGRQGSAVKYRIGSVAHQHQHPPVAFAALPMALLVAATTLARPRVTIEAALLAALAAPAAVGFPRKVC
jgi:hypothetical protein